MTDEGSKFEVRRLKVPESKHKLKGNRMPNTEKRKEGLVLLDERSEGLYEDYVITSIISSLTAPLYSAVTTMQPN